MIHTRVKLIERIVITGALPGDCTDRKTAFARLHDDGFKFISYVPRKTKAGLRFTITGERPAEEKK